MFEIEIVCGPDAEKGRHFFVSVVGLTVFWRYLGAKEIYSYVTVRVTRVDRDESSLIPVLKPSQIKNTLDELEGFL